MLYEVVESGVAVCCEATLYIRVVHRCQTFFTGWLLFVLLEAAGSSAE
jgi:hypothetical protein